MLTLVLADTELERVPAPLQHHPAVRASARKRGRSPAAILLDSSMHHPALRRYSEGERRGRPDIAHIVLVAVSGGLGMQVAVSVAGIALMILAATLLTWESRLDRRGPKLF